MLGFAASRVFEVAWKSALVLIVWAVLDYLFERQHLSSELKMSRQELVDEYKETEGNPVIKGRIRRLQRQMRRRKMLEDTKRAAVVITNPTSYAIALEYRTDLPAPVVVAKGRNLFAAQIKEIARWENIPMVENQAARSHPLPHRRSRTEAFPRTSTPSLPKFWPPCTAPKPAPWPLAQPPEEDAADAHCRRRNYRCRTHP